MSPRECGCDFPRPRVTPGKEGWCVRCSGWINPEWSSNDATVAGFYDILEHALFPYGPAPPDFEAFRQQAEDRERAGRPVFGQSFHGRDNPLEGTEEFADGANYSLFATLVAKRAGEEVEWGYALTAAQKAYEAHRAIRELRRHLDGAP